MTDLNSQLNYSASVHYQQQQQQYQDSLQKLQANLKEKAVMNNDPNLMINIPLEPHQTPSAVGSHDQVPPIPQVAPGQAATAAVQAQAQAGGPSFAWNSNFNNNGLFTDTLSPFFAPYGIDVSHFPLTNPPIFESSMMMNNNGQPRRRISISNGQIGQITTHTLNGEDLYDSQPPPLPKQTSQDDSGLGQPSQMLYNQLNADSAAQNPTPSPAGGQVAPHLIGGAPHQQQIPITQHQQQQQQQQVLSPASRQQQQQPQHQHQHLPQHQHQQQPIPQQQPTPNVKQELPFQTSGSGIPSHKLVYNNEVIFNPDAGPIPGTAAWKKARLLERNRIAASKCRQRKKAAHIQLKEDVEKYQSQINRLKREKRMLFEALQSIKELGLKNDGLTQVLSRIPEVAHPDQDDEDVFDDDLEEED